MLGIVWTRHVTNKEVLKRIKTTKYVDKNQRAEICIDCNTRNEMLRKAASDLFEKFEQNG